MQMYYTCTRSKIGKGRGKREPFFPPQQLLGRGGVVIQKVRAFSILLVFLLQVEVMHNLPEILVFHDILGREELEEIKLIAQPWYYPISSAGHATNCIKFFIVCLSYIK